MNRTKEAEEFRKAHAMHWATFNSFELQIRLSDAHHGSHQGSCDDDIAALSRVWYIAKQLEALDVDKLRTELDGYGAWDETELADHEQNLQRILWLACGNIVEEAQS